jgi:hypothetical protein
MLNLAMLVYVAVLFYVLTPGILVTLPSRSSKMVVAATHAVVFAVVFKLTYKAVWRMTMQMSGFQNQPAAGPMMMPKKEGFAKTK